MVTQYPTLSMRYAKEARKHGGSWSVQRWYLNGEKAVSEAQRFSEEYPEYEWRVVKYPELRVIWVKTPSYSELESERPRKKTPSPKFKPGDFIYLDPKAQVLDSATHKPLPYDIVRQPALWAVDEYDSQTGMLNINRVKAPYPGAYCSWVHSKYAILAFSGLRPTQYYEFESDRSKRRVARLPERKIEAFIPPEEVYQASYWGQFKRFEREALTQPDREVCVPTSIDELKKRYLELVKMREDPKIPYEERKKIAEQAREALDDLMKGSPNYGKFKKWREEQEQWRQVRAPGIDYSKVPEVFKTGLPPSEARKYRRFR